jgi:hypothetical protein
MNMFSRAKRSLAITAMTLLAVVGLTSKEVRAVSFKRMSRSKYVPHHSAREAARRRRQMEAGTLRAVSRGV